MKELSIEEKAQRYDEALKAAVVAHKDEDKHLKATLERIFPELKESEDERIRKEMILYFEQEIPQCSIEEHKGYMRKFIAWLKRKGEQKPADKVEPKFKVGDVVTNKKSKDTVKIVQILHDSYCYSGWDGAATVHSDFSISEQDDWQLVERNPAWSEDDSPCFDDICELLMNILHSENHNYNKEAIKKDLNWLKSIKDRVGCEVNCTTTKGWSEEDLCKIENALFGTYAVDVAIRLLNKIKFLRPQNTWKPSDEQIKVLNEVLNFAANHESPHWNDYIFGTLNNHIRQLKKLRVE